MVNWIYIDYDKLPKDFFDRVIYYEKTCPSGLLDVDDQFKMILDNGEQYYLYLKELRDCDYRRVIPFVNEMSKGIPDFTVRHIGAENLPEGWCYYYHFHQKCFMKKEVFEKFQKYEETIREISRQKDLERWFWWYEQIEKLLEEEYGMKINNEKAFHIRMNELIRVYSKRYEDRHISLEQFLDNPEEYLEEAILISEELREGKDWRNGYEINIYFEDKHPYRICGDEAVTISADVYGNNFIYYPISNMHGWKDGCWVRKDIYEKYYESVIVPLEQVRPKRLYYCSEI